MRKTRIIIQSGSDLPMDLAEKYDITVVPDIVIFGNKEYLAGVDIQADEFYRMMAESPILPTSSHPNIAQFIEAYSQGDPDVDIVVISVTSKMTGGFNTAHIAMQLMREKQDKPNIYVFDSQQCSCAIALMAIAAAKLGIEGKTGAEIVDFLERHSNEFIIYFMLNSLNNARKSGRVGTIKALAADVLGVKPILEFKNGYINDAEIARNFNVGIDSLLKRFSTMADDTSEILIFHALNEPSAIKLRDALLAEHPNANVRIDLVGPVIGTYGGLGALGIAFRRKT